MDGCGGCGVVEGRGHFRLVASLSVDEMQSSFHQTVSSIGSRWIPFKICCGIGCIHFIIVSKAADDVNYWTLHFHSISNLFFLKSKSSALELSIDFKRASSFCLLPAYFIRFRLTFCTISLKRKFNLNRALL